MQFYLKIFYALILSHLLSLQAFAILGGKNINNPELKNKIVSFDVRQKMNSIICTGSFISNNKLLTAAHCLEHLSLDCDNCKQKIIIDQTYFDFSYHIHPQYKKRNFNKNYSDTTNYDIAIIELHNFKSKDKLKVNFNYKDNNQETLTYFGYGMSTVKKRNVDGLTYYDESGRGQLKVGEIQARTSINGLLMKENENVKINSDNKINLDTKSQVLRSDSGGPLIYKNQIIGLVRNYEIRDTIEQRGLAYNIINLKMISTFTLFNNSSIKDFISKHQ